MAKLRYPPAAMREPDNGCEVSVLAFGNERFGLLHLVVERGGLTIDDDHAALELPFWIHRQYDTVAEFLIQIFIEKVDWLHDVHVAVDKTRPFFMADPPGWRFQRSEMPVRTNREPGAGALFLLEMVGRPCAAAASDQRLR